MSDSHSSSVSRSPSRSQHGSWHCRVRSLLIVLVAFSLTTVTAPSMADVIFSNLGPNGSFLNGPLDSAPIFLNATGGTINQAVQFTVPSGSYPWKLDTVEMPLGSSAQGGPHNISVHLRNDNAGLPGGFVEFMPLGGITSTPTLLTATSTQNSLLIPGQSYWIAGFPAGITSDFINWYDNPLGQLGHAQQISNLGWGIQPNDPTPGLRINATLMPPPCFFVNPGFDVQETIAGPPPNTFGDWQGDQASVVAQTLGITPHQGPGMLQFDGTTAVGPSPNTIGSEVWQLVDVSQYAAPIEFVVATRRTPSSPPASTHRAARRPPFPPRWGLRWRSPTRPYSATPTLTPGS